MQRLVVDARRIHYKPTQGVNRGWRRSRLGGNQGSHFYAWWAPKNAAPLKEADGFSQAPEGAVFLRDIRHHDDHSPPLPQSLEGHYLALTVPDLRREEYGPAPWTPPQARFAVARQSVRMLKGHPGSGKTTALWHAADSSPAEHILYVTYSRDLAALARDYFDRYCSSRKRFHVVTFPNLVRELLGLSTPVQPERELRQRFAHDLLPFARTLGPWMASPQALFDELHAHLVGDALPVAIGRFAAAQQARVSDQAYRERRTRYLGPQAAAVALEAAARLERTHSAPLADCYFPELALAWQAVERLRARSSDSETDPTWLDFDCIAVDESQDLTPIEALVVVELAARINSRRRTPVSLLVAGDEAQTVRPTDFEWGWLSDLLHTRIGTPSEYSLPANLRSPRHIAELVSQVWDLYSRIEKGERPRGTGYAEIDDDAADQVLYCTAVSRPVVPRRCDGQLHGPEVAAQRSGELRQERKSRAGRRLHPWNQPARSPPSPPSQHRPKLQGQFADLVGDGTEAQKAFAASLLRRRQVAGRLQQQGGDPAGREMGPCQGRMQTPLLVLPELARSRRRSLRIWRSGNPGACSQRATVSAPTPTFSAVALHWKRRFWQWPSIYGTGIVDT
ncbi:MAG: hypothetical protein ACLQOO_02930 [Terriglobia bacterium]